MDTQTVAERGAMPESTLPRIAPIDRCGSIMSTYWEYPASRRYFSVEMRKTMTTTKYIALAALALAALAAALAQVAPPPAPQGSGDSTAGQDWEMVSGHPAGYGYDAGGQWPGAGGGQVDLSEMFLYNKRTGKAYKYFPWCSSGGQEADQGCFFAIQVIDQRAGFQVHVQPTSGGPVR